MTRFEDRILNWLEVHRILLGYIFATVLALFLRKVAVWWTQDDMVDYYNGHANRVQGELWLFIMRIGLVFPVLPTHFMKWVASVGDLTMAATGAVVLSGVGRDRSAKLPERGLVFYSVVLIMPFTLYRGIVMSMTDSWGIACFLLGYFVIKKGILRILIYACGVLFCPALVIPLCIEFMRRDRNSLLLGIIAVTIGVSAGLLGLFNGTGFWNGVLEQVNFLFFDALTGESFTEISPWIMAMLGYYMLPASVMGLVYLQQRK